MQKHHILGYCHQMDTLHTSTSLGKIGNTLFRLDYHQVNIHGLVSDASDGVQNERPNGDVGDESAIHDINVDPIAASFVDLADLLAETREISAEDTGGDLQSDCEVG